MMLVEEGEVGVREDMSRYLPEGLVPGNTPRTLAQSMSHRPGFEESHAIFDPAIAALPRAEALAASLACAGMERLAQAASDCFRALPPGFRLASTTMGPRLRRGDLMPGWGRWC